MKHPHAHTTPCRDCPHVIVARSRRALLEAQLDHATWKMLKAFRRVVLQDQGDPHDRAEAVR